MSQTLNLLRVCVSLSFLLFPLLLSAQEICDNGIDDDADGLIDLNDRADCTCQIESQTPSLLPNPSLEEFSADQPGCKSSQPGGLPDGTNQANCLVGWQRASLGTTDAWNAFTLAGSEPDYPSELPLPLPSGSGVAGFWVGIKDTDGIQFANGDGSYVTRYREYLAACFEEGKGIEAGEDYQLTFSLGFMEPQTYNNRGKLVDLDSPSGVELSIYGIRECGQLDFGNYQNCPEEAGAEGYELLANITVEGSGGTWTESTVNFTASNDYAAFAIGGSCGSDLKREDSKYYRNYYFIDNLILNRTSLFQAPAAGPIRVEGESICDDEIVLTGHYDSEAAYQWYRDGIAITGANQYTLTLNEQTGKEGNYQLRAIYPRGCSTSEPVRIQRPVIPEQFPDSVALCADNAKVRLYATQVIGAQYAWSDGTSKSSVTITEPGTYSVTVTVNCQERVEEITAVEDAAFSYRYRLSPEKPCMGDTVEITVESDWYTDGVMYIPDNGGFFYQGSSEPLRVIAGETSSLNAMLFTPCNMYADIITIPAYEPFTAEAAITDVNCQGAEGSIALSITGGSPTSFDWSNSAQKSFEGHTSEIAVQRAGHYSVTVYGEDRCETQFDYKVGDRKFALDLIPTDVSCGDDGKVSAFPSGGTPPYRIEWRTAADNPPLTASSTELNNLSKGTYFTKVTDAGDCFTEASFTIDGPEPMSVTTTENVSGCFPDHAGQIEVAVQGGTGPFTYHLLGTAEQSSPLFSGLTGENYQLEVRDALDCHTETIPVTLSYPDPVTLDLGEDLLLDLGETITLQAETNEVLVGDVSVDWSFTAGGILPDGDFFNLIATLTPERSGTVTASLLTPDGCTYTDDVFLTVQNTVNIYVPTAFSPNGDGVNDVLTVYSNVGVTRIENFQVFDRWGGQVFTTEAREVVWDGTRGGDPLDPGSYLYSGVARLRNGQTKTIRGSVLLMR
ncbi:gliding motility-associated C-terminal domain-containing protein [Lewinella sp. IMCC34191]|uniref:T9SS type B sorting domain-containing protein n=1 Tax=Lewinella sp. IMCC34191 TaxID=2259172 RepID=UPI0018E57D0D|nr:gliding motility-associated C-terminal domain-containing protein [Lewinella sp. IMCC34191]